MAMDQADYLQGQDKSGLNLSAISQARENLRPINDPRLYELQFLQKSDQEAYKERLKGLSKSEKQELSSMAAKLHSLKAPQDTDYLTQLTGGQ